MSQCLESELVNRERCILITSQMASKRILSRLELRLALSRALLKSSLGQSKPFVHQLRTVPGRLMMQEFFALLSKMLASPQPHSCRTIHVRRGQHLFLAVLLSLLRTHRSRALRPVRNHRLYLFFEQRGISPVFQTRIHNLWPSSGTVKINLCRQQERMLLSGYIKP